MFKYIYTCIYFKWHLLLKSVVISDIFLLDQDVLTMHVAHNGYTDPNSLKFENITVMGVSAAPASVLVSDGVTTNSLLQSQVNYDSTKKVIIKEFSIHHQSQYETVFVTSFTGFD